MEKIFFDTEFTGLHKNTTLISIGLVDKDGRTFYAEFSDYDESQCDNWIHENVIKNLKWGKEGPIENFTNIYEDRWEAYGDKKYIKKALYDWLTKYDSVELVSDVCYYDMVLFIDIFGSAWDIPSIVNPACHDINQDIARHYNISEKEAFGVSREDILSSNNWIIDDEIMKHNALYDAKVIKEIYNIVKQREQIPPYEPSQLFYGLHGHAIDKDGNFVGEDFGEPYGRFKTNGVEKGIYPTSITTVDPNSITSDGHMLIK